MTIIGRPYRTLGGTGALILAVALAAGSHPSLAGPAAWTPNGEPACALLSTQESPNLASLGTGGVVIVWADRRSGEYDIYAQRLDSAGAPQWQAGGVQVCGAEYDQQFPMAVPDGAGGVIVSWQDGRKGDDGMEIYAQRMGGDGSVVWVPDGLPVCLHDPDLVDPPTAFSHVMCGDGSGGAIVAWRDTRSDPVHANTEIYAQRIDPLGAPLWSSNGQKVLGFTTSKWTTRNPIIASDGSGGAVIVWQDGRNTASAGNDLYAQRITSAGSPAWAVNGIALCAAAGEQGYPDITPAENGVIVTWEDKRGGAYDVYAQRLDLDGAAQWGADGRAVCSSPGDQRTPRVAANGTGGYLIAWSDSRLSPPQTDLFAQTLNESGEPVWAPQGVATCTAQGSQTRIRMAPSLPGSVILTWMDTRNETSAALYDIYGQRLTSTGLPAWEPDGLEIAVLPGSNQRLQQTTSDGLCGAYTTWEDNRNAGDWDVYAHRLSPWTLVGDTAAAKLGAPEEPVLIPTAVVTAAFSGFFFVEDAGRYSGLKVVSSQPVTPGDVVMVGGTIEQDCAPLLNAAIVVPIGLAPVPRPLGMSAGAVGGQGTGDPSGVPNAGLLIRIWGRVLVSESQPPRSVLVSDGSQTVTVYTDSPIAVGDFIIATGVSSCRQGDAGPEPVVLTRDASDVLVLPTETGS